MAPANTDPRFIVVDAPAHIALAHVAHAAKHRFAHIGIAAIGRFTHIAAAELIPHRGATPRLANRCRTADKAAATDHIVAAILEAW